MQREVFDVVGMPNAFVFGSQPLPASFPDGHENGDHIRDYYQFDGFGDGGVIATAPDVAKFYRALFIDRSLLPAK
jgi:D-alanyl-D-alanine carboxypeptidase